MISRLLLSRLLFAFIALIVSFAVIMSFQALASALGDAAGARILFMLAVACLLFWVITLICLVAALATRAIWDDQTP